MGTRNIGRDPQTRLQLAAEAARAMVEGGISDYGLAKRKAQERMRLPSGTPLPSNKEVEDAVHEYLRLFGSDDQALHLRNLRETAVTAMREFKAFKPRLVGAVLTGTADHFSAVSLHLFADTAEEVGFILMDRGIPHRNIEQRLRMSTGSVERIPGYSFLAGDVELELLVFGERARGQTPLSPVDGRAMRRASLVQVEALLAASAANLSG